MPMRTPGHDHARALEEPMRQLAHNARETVR